MAEKKEESARKKAKPFMEVGITKGGEQELKKKKGENEKLPPPVPMPIGKVPDVEKWPPEKAKPFPVFEKEGPPGIARGSKFPEIAKEEEKKARARPLTKREEEDAKKMGQPVYYVQSVIPGKEKNPFRESGERFPDTYIIVKINRGQLDELKHYDKRIQDAKDKGDVRLRIRLQEARDAYYKGIMEGKPEKYSYTVSEKYPPLKVGETYYAPMGFRPETMNLTPISPEAQKNLDELAKNLPKKFSAR